MTPIKRVDPLEFIFSWVTAEEREPDEEYEGCDPEYYSDILDN